MLTTATLGMRFLRRCEKCVQDGSAKYFTPGEITVCCVVPFPDLAWGLRPLTFPVSSIHVTGGLTFLAIGQTLSENCVLEHL